MEHNVNESGDLKCTCGRVINPDLTNLSDKCIYCYCCEALGTAIIDGDYRFYHDEFLKVTKYKYEDDGCGHVDKMEKEYKKISFCPFCRKDLSKFVSVRLKNLSSEVYE